MLLPLRHLPVSLNHFWLSLLRENDEGFVVVVVLISEGQIILAPAEQPYYWGRNGKHALDVVAMTQVSWHLLQPRLGHTRHYRPIYLPHDVLAMSTRSESFNSDQIPVKITNDSTHWLFVCCMRQRGEPAEALGTGVIPAWSLKAWIVTAIFNPHNLGHNVPEEFLHLMFFGVVGDLVGDASGSASSLWFGSLSLSSRTERSAT